MEHIDPIEEFLTAFEEFMARVEESLPSPVVFSQILTYELPEKPICLIFSSDIHFGSFYTNLSELVSIYDTLLNSEDVYLILNGDVIDNYDVFSGKLLAKAVNSQALPPVIQRNFLLNFLRALGKKGKLLAFVAGNHEEFSSLDFLSQAGVPLGLNRVRVDLFVGKAKVIIACIHKSRFNSVINPVHSAIRELHLNYPYADVVVTSHTHLPALMTYPYPTENGLRMRWLIKTGSLKDLDPYTYKNFSHYPVSHISTPALIIKPDGKILGFHDYRDALSVINLMKGGA